MKRTILAMIIAVAPLAFGINNANAQKAPSAPTTNVVVAGTIQSVDGDPLTGLDWPYAWIGLYKFDQNGVAQWVNSSDCWYSGQGCADWNGSWSFYTDWQGNTLQSGNYMLMASAAYYQVQWKKISVNAKSAPTVLKMEYQSLNFDWYNFTCTIPPAKGGSFQCQMPVFRIDGGLDPLALKVYPSVSGPSQMYGYVTIPLDEQKIVLDPWGYETLNIKAWVPKDAPDGLDYCITVMIGQDPWHIITSSAVCTVKGYKP